MAKFIKIHNPGVNEKTRYLNVDQISRCWGDYTSISGDAREVTVIRLFGEQYPDYDLSPLADFMARLEALIQSDRCVCEGSEESEDSDEEESSDADEPSDSDEDDS